jgi:hypothetical protein
MSEHRSLLMRANRTLGAALVEANLVKIDDLMAANERLLELLQSDAEHQATLLGVLMFEKKVLGEADFLQYLIETAGIGLIDLRNYEVPEEFRKDVDLGSCWATWTVPFDKEEDFYFVASAYYLSTAVRSHWEKQLGGNILWYGTTLEVVSDFLEKIDGGPAKAVEPAKVAKSA